jgi:nitrogen fixation/metabolism regulation signal transduction histidine kinase
MSYISLLFLNVPLGAKFIRNPCPVIKSTINELKVTIPTKAGSGKLIVTVTVRAQTSGEGENKTLTSAFNLMLSRIDAQSRQIQKHTQELELKVA